VVFLRERGRVPASQGLSADVRVPTERCWKHNKGLVFVARFDTALIVLVGRAMNLVGAIVGPFGALQLAGLLASVSTPGDQSLSSLIGGIITHHHALARSELDRLSVLVERVDAADAALAGVTEVVQDFTMLDSELRAHMTKEEVVVFPYIASLEGAQRIGRSLARSPFSALQEPLDVMLDEQGQARSLLASMRRQTKGYTPPPNASEVLCALYEGLEALEAELEEHGRLETEVLLPRALELEQRMRG
jgi:regulator of cell morphogenesis and NO signaling